MMMMMMMIIPVIILYIPYHTMVVVVMPWLRGFQMLTSWVFCLWVCIRLCLLCLRVLCFCVLGVVVLPPVWEGVCCWPIGSFVPATLSLPPIPLLCLLSRTRNKKHRGRYRILSLGKSLFQFFSKKILKGGSWSSLVLSKANPSSLLMLMGGGLQVYDECFEKNIQKSIIMTLTPA